MRQQGTGAAAGAAIGTAIAPGIGTALGALAGGFLDQPSNTSSGVSAAPAGPRSAAAAVYGSGLNADNWFVNFGGTQNARGQADKELRATGPTASTAAEGGSVMPAGGGLGVLGSSIGGVPVWAIVAVGGLIAWRLVRSSR